MKKTTNLHSFSLSKVKFEDENDFRLLMEAIAFNKRLFKLRISYMIFNSENFGKALGTCIMTSQSL